ncbi:MAG TPA: YkgJ family cysteine cluster protein [Longilinea sp.]|nr:YkgJ family cysteine cluster protein [Longilinea sp.]
MYCGACCAHYRVSFYWRETDPSQGGTVPPELTDDLPPYSNCMKGTNQPSPRCIALEGTVGGCVHCAIYDNRPSPCREFGIHWRSGKSDAGPEDLSRCNAARAAWNLPPLAPATPQRDKRRPVTLNRRHVTPVRRTRRIHSC